MTTRNPQQQRPLDIHAIDMGERRWAVTDKGDPRCRVLADRHYTRQTVGHPLWTRPGWNLVLYASDGEGTAAWCWWRPKWESGIEGTERKDGLRAVECTLFRNETRWLSSSLIREASAVVQTWEHWTDVDVRDGLITGVGSSQTAKRRGRGNRPGHCFRMAGWVDFEHKPGKADVWLRCVELPPPQQPRDEPRGQLALLGGDL